MRRAFSQVVYRYVDILKAHEGVTLTLKLGTGIEFDAGQGKGQNHAINVPLRRGLCGPSLLRLFLPISSAALSSFKPDCVVLQLGADGLSADPLNVEWNLDTHVLPSVVRNIISWSKPMLILGGGGYHNANCARTWTLATGKYNVQLHFSC